MKNFHLFFFAIISGLILSSNVNADLISEFQPNPVGTDPTNVNIELAGTASAAFDLWLLSIESDIDSAFGTIDRVSNVVGNYDANGLTNLMIPDLENPSFTLLLVEGFSGSVGDSIDGNSDGIVDNTPWTSVMDAIGIPDTDGEVLYGVQLGGQDFAYTGDEPKLVFRDGTTGAWYAANDPDNGSIFDISATDVLLTGSFDIDPFNPTFGSVNPSYTLSVPEPGGLILLGLVGLVGLARRRK